MHLVPQATIDIPEVIHHDSNLPLESCIHFLKQNGFSIKPDDYIEILKVIERFRPATLQEAGNLIGPLIITNAEEQSRFYSVFDRLCQADVAAPAHEAWWKRLARGLKKILQHKAARIILVAIPLLIIAAWLFTRDTKKVNADYEIVLSESLPIFVGDSIYVSAFRIAPVDKDGFAIPMSDLDKKELPEITWRFPDSISKNQLRRLWIVPAAGPHSLILNTEKGNTQTADTLSLNACDKLPLPSISYDSSLQPRPDSRMKLTASFDAAGFEDLSTAWIANGDTVGRNNNNYDLLFETPGDYFIQFVIINPTDRNCYTNATVTFSLPDPNAEKYIITTSGVGNNIVAPRKMRGWITGALFSLFIASLITTLGLREWRRRRRARMKNILDSLMNAGSETKPEKKPVFEIPIENRQQQLVASEPAINDVMRFMQQRTLDESLGLNIPRTVQTTIRSGGIPELVYTNKLRQNDYLVLIDATIVNSQQVKLFEYLVASFRNENISVTRFFYQDNFSRFYNEQFPGGISIKRVSEIYKDYTLIIFGDGHHLVYAAYPVIDTQKLSDLSEWENKAILTPVPYKDWSAKETVISSHLILLPADPEGQLRLVKAINEKLLQHRDYLSSVKNFYSARRVDFKDPEDIRKYLGDEDLFQWICAIAVYSKLRWEIIIEIGKAVLQSRNCPEKMNFSNLLKLVRISWMHEGFFPETTRLELLKLLGVNEEIVARKKLLELFENTDLRFKDQYYFSGGKKLEEITNRYIVYSHDPGNHAALADSREEFESLYKNNKIADATLKEYLDNNGKKEWTTPLKKNDGSQAGTMSLGSDRINKRTQSWAEMTSFLAGFFLLLIFILSFLGKDIAKWRAMQVAGLTVVDSSAMVPVTVSVDRYGRCIFTGEDSSLMQNLIIALVGADTVRYESTGKNSDSTSPSLPSETFLVPYGDLSKNQIDAEIAWITYSREMTGTNNPNSQVNIIERDTILGSVVRPLSITSDRIQARISACANEQPYLVTIFYNDSARMDEVNALRYQLENLNYREVTTEYRVLSDSQQVKYFDAADRRMAESIANAVSSILGKIFEVRTEPSAIARDSKIEILLYSELTKPSNCNSIPVKALPTSLSEIWRGLTNNRLMNINLNASTIFYSTGDASTYGRYVITNVCADGKTFKLILRGDGTYTASFIRNISRTSFEFALCPQTYPTAEGAIQSSGASCNFERMQWYYPQNSSIIYIPFNSINYTSTESAKVNSILQQLAARQNSRLEVTYNVNSGLYSSNTILTRRQNQVSNNSPFLKRTDIDKTNAAFRGSPFDRDYISYSIKQDPNPSPKNNGKITIRFQPGSIYLDKSDISLINQMGREMGMSSGASIIIRANYTIGTETKTAQARVRNITNELSKFVKNVNAQVKTELQGIAMNEQRDVANNVEIEYYNFSANFNRAAAN